MKLNIFIVSFFLSTTVFGQINDEKRPYFLKTFQLGTSFTYTWERNAYSGNDYYGELTWNANFTARLSKRFWLGVQAAPIFSIERLGLGESGRVNFFAGVLTQFDFLNRNGLRIYGETSLNKSDYCTCGSLNPETVDGLNTWGGGGGLELSLNEKTKDNLKLELAFFNYVILNDIPDKYNFTQYIFGINYTFGKN